MEFQIKPNELRENCKIFIATPMYGGNNHGLFLKSCLDLQALCMRYGIELKFSFLFNESLITRARNYLCDEFMRATGHDGKPYTHLMFVDSDIHFDPMDILALLTFDKDIIGAPYPKKSINWGAVWTTCKKLLANPEFIENKFNPAELDAVTGEYVFNAVPGTVKFSVLEPVEMLEIGTGFMCIKRGVFEKFKEEYPHLQYRPDHRSGQFDGTQYIHAYFDTVIDPDSHRYLSEDYMFCQYWRNIGGKVWLCPWMKNQHIGTYPFTGDLPRVAMFTGSAGP
jgi:hypothetical protein